MSHTALASYQVMEGAKGESLLWVTCCCDISHDITPLLMSFSSSEGPDIGQRGGIGNAGVVIQYSADSPVMTAFVREATVGLDVSRTIAQHTLVDLGTAFSGVFHLCTPSTGSFIICWAVFPPIGEVVDACIKHSARDVRREGGILEDVWLKAAEHIGMSQHAERVVLLPLCVPIEF